MYSVNITTNKHILFDTLHMSADKQNSTRLSWVGGKIKTKLVSWNEGKQHYIRKLMDI